MDPRTLREATRAEHEATEALMPLMGPELSRSTYVQVLQVLLPLLRSWEAWADLAAEGELQGMLQQRRRSHLLAADLQVFGVEAAETGAVVVDWGTVVSGEKDGRAVGLDRMSFEAKLLGAVYVMEGSTLGGRFLARGVEAALGLQPGVGSSYFQGHGEATGAMWREVLGEISAIPEDYAPLTIASAKRTFEAFGESLRTGLTATQTVHS